MFRYFSFKRLLRYICLALSGLPMRGHHRWVFLKWAGVKFTQSPPRVFIYSNVKIDTIAPENITIGNNVRITSGVKILTHYLDTNQPSVHFRIGYVTIEDDVFIGMNAIICNSVTIGRGAVVGAGAVVTKDIPPYQIWAGNPARHIKDRAH